MNKIYNRIKYKFKDKTPFLIVFFLIILFIAAYLYNNIVITIGPGEGGVLYKRFFGGTVVDRVYREGVKFIFPWDMMFVYNARVQEVSHEFDVLTKNGLKVHLFISIRYYPEYKLLGVLHKKVGQDYVNKVVIPEIESVLRILIGQLNAKEVYTTKRSIIEKSINEAVEQIAQRFVNVDDVLIKKIELPPKVEEAIQNKIEQKHIADAYRFRIEREKQEAERKRIEAGGLKRYNEIVGSSLTDDVLLWMGIKATLELAKSNNTKVVVIGSGKKGLPIIGNIPMEQLNPPGSFDQNGNLVLPEALPQIDSSIADSSQGASGITDKKDSQIEQQSE